MNERALIALRFPVIAVAGYLSLATSAEPEWYTRSAYIDVPLEAASAVTRVRVTLEAEAVIILAPEALNIRSSSGVSWTPNDGPFESDGYCSAYHRLGIFCEEVSNGSDALEYELLMAAAAEESTARVEVLAGGLPERLQANFGVSIEVLP